MFPTTYFSPTYFSDTYFSAGASPAVTGTVVRINRYLGGGPIDHWEDPLDLTPAEAGHVAQGRFNTMLYRYRFADATSIDFSQCRDNEGATFSTAVNIITDAISALSYAAGTHLKNGYGLLYKRDDSEVVFYHAGNPNDWSDGTIVLTGLAGHPVGLTRTRSDVLVGLLWDWNGTTGSKTFTAIRSRDRGLTWEAGGAPIPVIPALDTPAQIVADIDLVIAGFVLNDAGVFVTSEDFGQTWQ